ncbi:hypothetical protein [Corallococcus sp. EGB]|uniref:hypothetical protein n=1 Tax=Corallococcus sp. EGB TaxID=1521117 RepID=UPI001CC021E8|nr:hypothetical protein [Corallococcus sp. EGB]
MTVETSETSSGGSPWPNRIILAIWFVCFSVGSLVHILVATKYGLFANDPDNPLPMPFVVVNELFTVLNPLTIVLLIFKRRAGILSALGVVALVYVLNLALMVWFWTAKQQLYVAWLYLNGSMGVFMALTAKRLWRAAPEAKTLPPATTPSPT